MQTALDADTSSRHLSCVETGRAHASKELLLQLMEVLEMPLRTRNSLLLAAGFSPHYRNTGLSDSEMDEVNLVLEKILSAHQPYPAMVLDKNFNILQWNQGFDHLVRLFVSDPAVYHARQWNMLRLLFDPKGWASQLKNIEEIYLVNMSRARRALEQGSSNAGSTEPGAESDALRRIMEEVAAWQPKYHQRWLQWQEQHSPQLVLPVHYHNEGADFKLFTTAASLGSPNNITLQELQVEAGYPVDESGEAFFREIHSPEQPLVYPKTKEAVVNVLGSTA